MRDIIKCFRALKDDTKIRILKVLQQRDELCVCEIIQALLISQSRASRNLGILKDAGFVRDRREGLWVFYSINHERVNAYHSALNDLLRGWLDDNPVIVEDRKRLEKAVRLGKPACAKENRNG